MPRGNPATGKVTRFDDHIHEALIENVLFLLEDCSIDVACVRLGVKKDSVEQAFRRHGIKAPWRGEPNGAVPGFSW